VPPPRRIRLTVLFIYRMRTLNPFRSYLN